MAAGIIALFGWIRAVRGLVLTAAPKRYERVGGSMGTIPLGRLVFGVLVAIGLTSPMSVGAARLASAAAKDTP